MKHLKIIPIFVAIGILLSGCGTSPADNDKTDGFQRINLTVHNSENPIIVTVEGNPYFEGSADTIDASEISSTGKGIISTVMTCADFDLCFNGSYEVIAPNAKTGRYALTTTGSQKSDEITLGINFYDLIMEASAMNVSAVKVAYKDSLELTGVSGAFELFVFVLSEHTGWEIGPRRLTISGTVNDCDVLLLKWSDGRFDLTSDAPIENLCVTGSEADGSEIFNSTAENVKSQYIFYNADGKYTIE